MTSSSGSTATLSSITLASNKKTSYYTGDEFVKPAVTAHYSDDTTADVTSATTFTQYDLTIAGSYTVKASYLGDSLDIYDWIRVYITNPSVNKDARYFYTYEYGNSACENGLLKFLRSVEEVFN